MHRRGREPRADLVAPLVEQHLLGQAEAQRLLCEFPVLGHRFAEQRQMIDAAHVDAAACEFHRQVLQGRAQLGRRLVAIFLVINLHRVAVGIAEAERAAAAEIAVAPAEAEARGLDRGDAPLERGRARRAPGDAADAATLSRADFERRGGIIAVAAEIVRVAFPVHDLHAEEIAEIPKRALGLRREQLDRAQLGHVLNSLACRFGHRAILRSHGGTMGLGRCRDFDLGQGSASLRAGLGRDDGLV